ncbi:MAG TPA: hypothetical protein DCX54_08025 [Flavobacteriales bacterium]|nr:hypothetical protein [Flavobacteriales bacterium]
MHKNDKTYKTATTIIAAFGWLCFATYIYCSGNDAFLKNHDSLFWKIGSSAISISQILAIISSILSTIALFIFRKDKHIYINLSISYLLGSFYLFIYLLVKITGGA